MDIMAQIQSSLRNLGSRYFLIHKRVARMSSSNITKLALANSLKQLMRSIPLHKISIRNVAENCGLNRQTFYYHFKDIYELIDWIYKTEAVESIAEYRGYDTWTEGLYRVFMYIKENREFCLNTLNSMSRTPLDNYLYDVTHNLLLDVINEISEGMDVDEERKEFVVNFYSLAFIGILVQWMTKGLKEDPRKIVYELSGLMEGNFLKALTHQ